MAGLPARPGRARAGPGAAPSWCGTPDGRILGLILGRNPLANFKQKRESRPVVYFERCAACKSGASGKTGHAHLVERFRSNVNDLALPQFATYQCTSCGALWRRLGSADRCDWSAERR